MSNVLVVLSITLGLLGLPKSWLRTLSRVLASSKVLSLISSDGLSYVLNALLKEF
jgi:hypothetical protein